MQSNLFMNDHLSSVRCDCVTWMFHEFYLNKSQCHASIFGICSLLTSELDPLDNQHKITSYVFLHDICDTCESFPCTYLNCWTSDSKAVFSVGWTVFLLFEDVSASIQKFWTCWGESLKI